MASELLFFGEPGERFSEVFLCLEFSWLASRLYQQTSGRGMLVLDGGVERVYVVCVRVCCVCFCVCVCVCMCFLMLFGLPF
jgi:hypothetical protein